MSTPEPKICVVCGREIEWRKKWERDWESVRYCSKSCRSRKRTSTDEALESAILTLLEKRSAGASICPSEVARAAAIADPGLQAESHADSEAWRELMEPVRMAARRLVAQGRIEITQKGRPVDPSTAKGPIRLRLVNRPTRFSGVRQGGDAR